MLGRDKNFQVSMMYELLNRENKISIIKLVFFIIHPLFYKSATDPLKNID